MRPVDHADELSTAEDVLNDLLRFTRSDLDDRSELGLIDELDPQPRAIWSVYLDARGAVRVLGALLKVCWTDNLLNREGELVGIYHL